MGRACPCHSVSTLPSCGPGLWLVGQPDSGACSRARAADVAARRRARFGVRPGLAWPEPRTTGLQQDRRPRSGWAAGEWHACQSAHPPCPLPTRLVIPEPCRRVGTAGARRCRMPTTMERASRLLCFSRKNTSCANGPDGRCRRAARLFVKALRSRRHRPAEPLHRFAKRLVGGSPQDRINGSMPWHRTGAGTARPALGPARNLGSRRQSCATESLTPRKECRTDPGSR